MSKHHFYQTVIKTPLFSLNTTKFASFATFSFLQFLLLFTASSFFYSAPLYVSASLFPRTKQQHLDNFRHLRNSSSVFSPFLAKIISDTNLLSASALAEDSTNADSHLKKYIASSRNLLLRNQLSRNFEPENLNVTEYNQLVDDFQAPKWRYPELLYLHAARPEASRPQWLNFTDSIAAYFFPDWELKSPKPENITIDLVPFSLTVINELEEYFVIDLIWQTSWHDWRLQFDKEYEYCYQLDLDRSLDIESLNLKEDPTLINPKRIWTPTLFNGLLSPREQPNIMSDATYLCSEGLVNQFQHGVYSFQNVLYRNSYPFDSHRLKFVFFDDLTEAYKVNPILSKSSYAWVTDSSTPGWDIKDIEFYTRYKFIQTADIPPDYHNKIDPKALYSRQELQELVYSMNFSEIIEIFSYMAGPYTAIVGEILIRRKPTYFILTQVFPMIVVVLMGGTAYWVYINGTELRLNIAITSVLTIMALSAFIGSEIPQVSYLTWSHTILITSYAYLLFVLFHCVCIMIMFRDDFDIALGDSEEAITRYELYLYLHSEYAKLASIQDLDKDDGDDDNLDDFTPDSKASNNYANQDDYVRNYNINNTTTNNTQAYDNRDPNITTSNNNQVYDNNDSYGHSVNSDVFHDVSITSASSNHPTNRVKIFPDKPRAEGLERNQSWDPRQPKLAQARPVSKISSIMQSYPITFRKETAVSAIPISLWNSQDVSAFMTYCGYPECAKVIYDREITGAVLLEMDIEDIVSLGLKDRIEALKVKAYIEQYRKFKRFNRNSAVFDATSLFMGFAFFTKNKEYPEDENNASKWRLFKEKIKLIWKMTLVIIDAQMAWLHPLSFAVVVLVTYFCLEPVPESPFFY